MSVTNTAQLAEELQRRLGPSWPRLVAWLRDNNGIADVAERIARGDYEGALAGLESAAARFASEVGGAVRVATADAAAWLDGNIGDRLITFDETNFRAVQAMSNARTNLIREVSIGQKNMVRELIRDGLSRGENPRVIARDIRYSIGLTEKQREYVTNFRRELEGGQWAAAGKRELIDGRWERTFHRLARDGGQLTPAQITQMTNRYSDNWVLFRAETISRTEGLRAAHVGHQMAFTQAIETGTIQGDYLEREWRHKRRGRHSRDGHVMMHGQKRAMGEPYQNPLTGALLMHPCDPDADISETANCTCVETIRYRPPVRRLAA